MGIRLPQGMSFFRCVLATLLALTVSGSAAQVAFSEVMYHPVSGKPEFIEVQNLTPTPLDMARWQFTAGIDFTFPDFSAGSSQAHFLGPNERILISSVTDATTRTAYPTIPAGVRIFGPWTGSLDNSGERITVKDKNGVVVATLSYGDSGKWPVQADGAGHSLVLTDVNREQDNWRVWRASTNNGGSPGSADPAPAAAGLAINEIHFSATGRVDWVELRNNSSLSAVSASGLSVASADNFADKVALSGSVVTGGLISADVDFVPDASGDVTIYLVDSSNNVRDAVKVQRKTGRDTWQQFPAGSREWYSATTSTRGTPNDPARNTDVVINEIMADPPSNQRDGEFVELYNRSANALDVSNWKLKDAVDFAFPPGTTIPAGGYLVVGANTAYLASAYPGLVAVGNFSGSLGNGGDRIRVEDSNGNLVNQVDYRFGGEWPEQAGGNGSSLELIHPDADNSLGGAWADSDESAKSGFTPFSLNLGTYQKAAVGGTIDDELMMWLVGDGHIILKNVVLRPTAGGANVLSNANVMTANPGGALTAVDGWQARGTHWQSYADEQGVHIIADGHGDNKANHMEKDASTASGTAGLVGNTAYTLTFDARWVSGKPRVVAQSWDLSIGGTALVPIPLNLGTPGAANSRLVQNVPPQVTSITNTPAVPTTNSTVTVTTRVSSKGGVSAVTLFHRLDSIDNDKTWSSLAMNDTGTNGDLVAGDGVYTGRISLASFSGYNATGAIVQFYVSAMAPNGLTAEQPKGGAESPALWVCDNQNPATDLRRLRVVIGAHWAAALDQSNATTGGHTAKFGYKFPKLSNHYFPCTFIHNDTEVFHGSFVRKTGSPFTRTPANSLDRARVSLPGDRDFRDKTKLYWDNDGAGSTMLHNRISRYWLYLLGVPGNENEVCRISKNNGGYAVRETNEAFDKDMLDRIWDNGSDGYWWEMDDRHYIADDGSTRLGGSDASFDYKVGDSQGVENPTAYHNQYVPKTREWEYNFAPLIALFKQIETNTAITPAQLERLVDVKSMAAYAAVRGYTADWDNITMSRGKNGFIYQRSTDRRFTFMHWDSDNALQANRVDDVIVGTLTNVGTNAPGFYSKPYVRRWLDFYLNQMITTYAANGPRMAAWLAAEENASTSYSVPSVYASWPTVIDTDTNTSGQNRHQRIQAFIGSASLNASFGVTSPADGTTVGSVTVDVTGTAPLGAANVICAGHPEGVFSWTTTGVTDVSPWKIAGIQLASGANTLVFRMLDENDAQVGSDVIRTINRTGNVPPVAMLAINPGSQNIGLGEVLSLDASASYDPESAGALSYSWTVSPGAGFSTTIISPQQRQLVFSAPGSYNVTLQVSDAGGLVSSVTRAISVFSATDRDDFNGKSLAAYSVQNVEQLDNYSPDAWYSLNELPGSLVIQITDRAAKPLNAGTPAFPLITRSMPATTDFTLQTNLDFVNPQIASFVAGLYLQTVENGVTTRYAFGLDGGTSVRVYVSSASGSYSAQGLLPYPGGDVTLRVIRSGTSLGFQQRLNGLWTTVYSKTLVAGSTVSTGGLFASTSAAQAQQVAFDYLLLSDPGKSTDLLNSLRITEIMYNPAGGGPEYIELQNTGTATINLNGAYFDEGNPFSTRFTFGNLSLAPGAYCVVTNSISAFQARYGTNVLIAGEATGALNNDGERVTLRDVDGNTIIDFNYGDASPWPAAADGGGKSIEVVSLSPGLYGSGTNWRASQETGGSPGYLGFASDGDGDGSPDAVEIAFGSEPNNAGDQPSAPAIALGEGGVTLTWRSQPGRTYKVQHRDDLETAWQDLGSVSAIGVSSSYLDSTANGRQKSFYRVVTQFP